MEYLKLINPVVGDLMGWFYHFLHYLPKLIVAIGVIVLFSFLGRFISRNLKQGLYRVSHNASVIELMSAVLRFVIITAGFFIALSVLGLEKTVTSLLAGAGILALAVGFAFQDLIANFISGAAIALSRPFQVGDTIHTNDVTGKVINIRIRSIVLDNGQGQTIEIPSKDVFQKALTNFSKIGQRRIEIKAGLDYVEDLEKAQQIAEAAIRQLPFIQPNREVKLHYTAFTDNAIQFVIWCWVASGQTDTVWATSEAIKALQKAFLANQITFFMPAHTFYLKQRTAQENPNTQT